MKYYLIKRDNHIEYKILDKCIAITFGWGENFENGYKRSEVMMLYSLLVLLIVSHYICCVFRIKIRMFFS